MEIIFGESHRLGVLLFPHIKYSWDCRIRNAIDLELFCDLVETAILKSQQLIDLHEHSDTTPSRDFETTPSADLDAFVQLVPMIAQVVRCPICKDRVGMLPGSRIRKHMSGAVGSVCAGSRTKVS